MSGDDSAATEHPPGRGVGLRLASLPWRKLPRPIAALLVLDFLLVALLPVLWPLLSSSGAPSPQVAEQREAGAPAAAPAPTRRPVLPGKPGGADEAALPKAMLIDVTRLRWASRFGVVEAHHSLLQHPIPAAATLDPRETAEIIVGQGLRWGINPQVLIALLDLQRGALGSTWPVSPTLEQGPLSAAELERKLGRDARQLHEHLIAEPRASLELSDGDSYLVPVGIDRGSYALLALLAPRHARPELDLLLGYGGDSFVNAFEYRFGPARTAPRPRLDDAPFLYHPFSGPQQPTGRFDHQKPGLQDDGFVSGGLAGASLGYDGHNGWDYTLPEGAPILAAAAGYVLYAGSMDNECASRAGAVIVEHPNGYHTLYWHLRRVMVSPGDEVQRGQLLGENGATGCASGPHLHFGVQRLGRDVDPYGWCGEGEDPWLQHPAGARSVFLWADAASLCPLPPGATVADDGNPDTALLYGDHWTASREGNHGSAHSAYGSAGASGAVAVWRPVIGSAGRYRCYAFVPPAAMGAGAVTYHIFYPGGEARVSVDQDRVAGSWAGLGSYRLLQGQHARVELRAAETQAGAVLWADAVACVREG